MFGGGIAFVTGAGNGIGQAICRILARDGARVIAADIHKKAAEDTVNSLKNPSEHLSVQIDVSNEDSVKEAFAMAYTHYGIPPKLLAQAAGITKDSFLDKMQEQQFMDVLNVNLKGTFLVQRELVQCLAKAGVDGGAVANLSSVVAKHGNMGQSNYASSKSAVEAFTKSTAKELGKKGIRVNCVVPGFIETRMVETIPNHLREMMLFVTPLKRMGKPQEVAEVVSFLLSDRSSYMTGALVEVTGGLSM